MPTADNYVDAVETLEKRLTTIDRYLTNDYIEEHLFSRNKSLMAEQSASSSKTQMTSKQRKQFFKKLMHH